MITGLAVTADIFIGLAVTAYIIIVHFIIKKVTKEILLKENKMPLSDIRNNEQLVNQGILVIRKDEFNLRIKQYKRATKPGESGSCGYGWCKYRSFISKEEFNRVFDELIKNGAVEG